MLCYSTGSLPDRPLSDLAALLAPTPFQGMEIVMRPEWLRHSRDFSHWYQIRRDIENQGLEIRNVHLGAPFLASDIAHEPGLSSLNNEDRQRKLDCVYKCMEIAEHLGTDFLTITTGLRKTNVPLADQEEAFSQSLATILHNMPKGIKLSLEQEPEHVIHSSQQMKKLCLAFKNQLYLTFDIGHSEVLREDIPKALKMLAPFLANLHFEDIRGHIHKHELFGDGDINYAPIINTLREIGYQGDYTPDLYPFADSYFTALQASEAFFVSMGIPV